VATAKDLVVKPIASSDANRIVRALHYSGKVVNNSQVHLGVFLDGKCGGAMQFGPSLDKRKLQGLVAGTLWNEFIELNRLAFADWLPRNGESRCIGYAMRWLRKTYPWLKWVVSFADAAQCGDGTIYRASGFVLTGIKVNRSIMALEDGYRFAAPTVAARGSKGGARVKREVARRVSRTTITKGGYISDTGGASVAKYLQAGATYLPGFQLRYLYFLDPTARDRLTVPILPFSEIERRGAGMYMGKAKTCVGSADSGTPEPTGGGGANPTPTLHVEATHATTTTTT